MPLQRSFALSIFCSVFLLIVSSQSASAADPSSVFKGEIQPILKANCYRCHGPKVKQAELDLSTVAGIHKGGESGPVFVSGHSAESLLIEMVSEGLMPPEEGKSLSKSEVESLKKWIDRGASLGESVDRPELVTEREVLPIFLRRCTVCHGGQFEEGGLSLRSRSDILHGSNSGPAIVMKKPSESLLIRRLEEQLCPPKADLSRAGIEPVTPEELDTLKQWISQGAAASPVDPQANWTAKNDPLVPVESRSFWAFQSPRKSSLPKVTHTALVQNPIDTFLLARLEAEGLSYSPLTDKRTLIRRVTLSLTGLPPTIAETNAFLADNRPDAYERLVDRLLESPRYGERWGKMWLDVAGYADSEGKRNADTIRPWAWRYRDYVIRSFNEDKSYAEFLVEQLAGDELVDYSDPTTVNDEIIEKLVATGFLRMAPDGTLANPVNRITDRIEVIADEIDVLSRGVMGLTMNCARCHSHKYDPLPQRDYYRLVAVFQGAYDEYDWMVPQSFGNQWKRAQTRYLDVLTESERERIAQANEPTEQKISEVNTKLQAENLSKADRKKLTDQLKTLQSKLTPSPKIRALWDRGRPSPTYIYRRGDETQPTRQVAPGPPSVLLTAAPAIEIRSPNHQQKKTGRRLAFARWLTQPQHPLTSRVMVNRLWHQHFGTGIVKSLDNFGKLGTPPSHPALLDWLAVEFVENDWSMKHIHRLIVTSTAYRQQSAITAEHEKLDPDNRLLSRMPMRRLSAEELRDSILLVAGKLNETPFGQPDPVVVQKEGLVTSKAVNGKWRRSIYVRHRRKEIPSLLETFDLPQMNPNCISRTDSTVVSQPLHLLNNKMIHELAGSLAARVKAESKADLDSQIQTVWELLFNRKPDAEELRLSRSALTVLTTEWQE